MFIQTYGRDLNRFTSSVPGSPFCLNTSSLISQAGSLIFIDVSNEMVDWEAARMKELEQRRAFINTWRKVDKLHESQIVNYYKESMSLNPEHFATVLIYTRGRLA